MEGTRLTTIIALDLSLAATGLCVWRDGDIRVETITTAPDECVPRRYRLIAGLIWPEIDRTGPTLVVKEARIIGQRSGSMDLIGLHAIVDYGLWARGIWPVVTVAPGTLKVFATGKGGASKEEVLLAAERRIGTLCPVQNNNEADSLWLGAMVLAQYGRPLVPLPAAHMRALKVPTWPAFELATQPREVTHS